jgi:hypothetical protein
VVVHLGVRLAFLGTGVARLRACFEDGPQEIRIVARAPRQDARGGFAEIRTVEISTDALHEISYALLGETRIGTRRTRLTTGKASVDTGREQFEIDRAGSLRV